MAAGDGGQGPQPGGLPGEGESPGQGGHGSLRGASACVFSELLRAAQCQPRARAHARASPLTTALTTDTDSEEDEELLKDEWSAQGPSSSKLTSSILCGMVTKSSKSAAGPKLSKRGLAGPRTLNPKPAGGRKQPFCLLLREAEARSSFSDSSEDSFDQGY